MFELGWLEETNLTRCNADQTNENIFPEYREFVKLHNVKFCPPCHSLRE